VIELSRALARRFRVVVRRILTDQGMRGASPVVVCQAGEHGLSLHAQLGDVAVCYHQAGPRTPATIAFLASLLTEIEGRVDAPVVLEAAGEDRARVGWSEGGVPRLVEFELPGPERVPVPPELPARLRPMPDDFAQVLCEAARTTARASAPSGVTRVQLRGKAGEVVATDGRQLLIQGGVPLPWKDDLLVPRLPVLGARDLPLSGTVHLGRTNDHVVLRIDDWTFWLAIDRDARFPSVQDVIPPATHSSRLSLDPADADFLMATLPKLPGRNDDHSPVTIDLTNPPAVRARSEKGGPASEVVLTRSSAEGAAVRVVTDRQLLLRAVQLGFTEIQVARPEVPLVARNDRRTFVWMPLDPKAAVLPGTDVLKLVSAGENAAPPDQPSPERRRALMPAPSGNGHPPEDRASGQPAERAAGINDLIAEVEALRDMLGDAATRAHRLLAALKHRRKQARAVEVAVGALRQINLGG
jgi:hypothetical protein